MNRNIPFFWKMEKPMKWKPKVFSLLTSIIISNANAGIMREDVSVQDYRDFAENLGKYTPGAENVEVFNSCITLNY